MTSDEQILNSNKSIREKNVLTPPPPVLGRAGALFHRGISFVAIHLYAKPRASRKERILFDGLTIDVPPHVFHPTLYFSSSYFAAYIDQEIDFTDKKVLDMGCGSGILSLIAARRGAQVLAADINPAAVLATLSNSERNNLAHRIETIETNLFEDAIFKGRGFDYILLNPPYYEGEPVSSADHAWRSGKGNRFIHSFAAEARNHLAPGGQILSVLSSNGALTEQLNAFTQAGYSFECLTSKPTFFERLYILRVVPNT